jgi:hypothetical protein
MQQRPHIAPDYDEDFFAWARHQAKLLRGLRKQNSALPQELDLAHVAEEIEDLGKAELRGATSLIRNIMVHLIKAASVPSADAVGHWRTEVTTFQADLPEYYTPSMRQRINVQKLWMRARGIAEGALQEHGASLASTVPTECPFLLKELVAEDFSFDAALERLRRRD